MMLSHNDLWSAVLDLDSLVDHYQMTEAERAKYNEVRKKLGWAEVREPDYSGSPGNMS